MSKCFLHIIDKGPVEVTTLDELRTTTRWAITEFQQFCLGAKPADAFHVQKDEHFIALGMSTVASWLAK